MPKLVLENVPSEVLDRLRRSAAASARSVSMEAVGLLTQRLPEPPLVSEEIPAPCDLPRGEGERVEAREGGERLPEPVFLTRE